MIIYVHTYVYCDVREDRQNPLPSGLLKHGWEIPEPNGCAANAHCNV